MLSSFRLRLRPLPRSPVFRTSWNMLSKLRRGKLFTAIRARSIDFRPSSTPSYQAAMGGCDPSLRKNALAMRTALPIVLCRPCLLWNGMLRSLFPAGHKNGNLGFLSMIKDGLLLGCSKSTSGLLLPFPFSHPGLRGSSSNRAGAIARAFAMASMLSMEIFRSPRSTEPIYVRCSRDRSASASWLSCCARRRRRIFAAKRSRVEERRCTFYDFGGMMT